MSGAQDKQRREISKTNIRERHKTIRAAIYVCGIVVSILIVVASATYLVVKLNEQPPWLTLCLAVFGPTGSVVVILAIYLRHLQSQIRKMNQRIAADLLEEETLT